MSKIIDKELHAIKKMLELLDPLTDEQAHNVLLYVTRRFANRCDTCKDIHQQTELAETITEL